MVGDVGARVVLSQKRCSPKKKVFSKKKVITCLAAICANHGNVNSVQVARSNRRATYGDYWIPILH